MDVPTSSAARIAAACAALGPGPLDEAAIAEHVAPLFARVLARNRARVYLANHSLGRPPDAMEDDVREALAAWYADLSGAWETWGEALTQHRERLATLMRAADAGCIVPKTSAGGGLRAVLNASDAPLRVTSTRGEFDSIDVILREYAHRGRIALDLVEARDGGFAQDDLVAAVRRGTDLLVVSHAMFRTGQLLDGIDALVAEAHVAGARVLVDVYHSLGVVPVDVAAMDVDFAIGGSYKYLRGGPGACFLYVAPRHLASGMRTLDIGWFAKDVPFHYERPDPPRFAAGGDGWMESTPPVLTWYQARAGQLLTLGLGVARLRAYSLVQQRALVDALHAHGIEAVGARADHGAFVVVRRDDAAALAVALGERGIDVDARGDCLRFCPDVLTTRAELDRAAATLAELV